MQKASINRSLRVPPVILHAKRVAGLGFPAKRGVDFSSQQDQTLLKNKSQASLRLASTYYVILLGLS
jgi:hypothetical protein